MKVHERLKARRKELGLTADEVAEAINVSRATYYRYESGEIEKLPTTIVPQLSKILRVYVPYLMGWDDNETLNNAVLNLLKSDDKELIDMLYDISIMTPEELNKLKTAYKILKSNIG